MDSTSQQLPPGKPRDTGPAIDEFLQGAVHGPTALRERLLSFIVHEIRNPLASGLWASEMLARQPGDAARIARLSNLAARSTRRLRVLVEDYFAIERLPEHAPPGRTGVREAVDRALGQHDLEPRGLAAPVEGGEGLVTPLDPGLLDKLLHACARRGAHAGSGGPMSVWVESRDGRAHVCFLRRDANAALLEPGLLAPGGSEGEGTTFSLMLARTAATRLGVTIEVSDWPEGGGLIRVILPLE